MSLAQTVWTPNNSVNSDISRAEERRVHGLGLSEPEMNAVLGEAKKSQKREKPLSANVKDTEERGASLRSLTSATADDVQRWLDDLKTRRNTDGQRKGRLICNAKQYEAVVKVASRVMRELQGESLGEEDYGEPLRWVIHGGPGTGKSHVAKSPIKNCSKAFCTVAWTHSSKSLHSKR